MFVSHDFSMQEVKYMARWFFLEGMSCSFKKEVADLIK